MTDAALSGVSETLLIPLVARAEAAERFPHLGLSDPAAKAILAELGADVDRIRADYWTMLLCCHRARWFDARTAAFLAAHPHATVLNLGCGLGTSHLRVAARRTLWVDVDLPPVIALRRRLRAGLPHDHAGQFHLAAADVTDPDAIRALMPAPERPLLVIAEGLLMYLTDTAVAGLFATLAEGRGNVLSGGGASECLFDYVGPLMQRFAFLNPAMRATAIGRAGEPFTWALEGGAAFEALAPRWRAEEDFDAISACGPIPAGISWLYGAMFPEKRIYGCIRAELKAHGPEPG